MTGASSTSPSPIRLLIHGARGKMGARLAVLARNDRRFTLVAEIGRDDAARAEQLTTSSIDAIVDFSTEQGACQAAQLAVRHRAALLVGTTGLSSASMQVIADSARTGPLMIAPNTSLGVAVLNHLAVQAARMLGSSFDVDLIEAHHAAKRDAPSGTAVRLAERLRSDAGIDLPPERVHCLRAGDIVGEHTVQFAGPGERITISHAATSRNLFAHGALRAIHWLAQQKPGRYSIEQSLGM